MTQSTYFIQVKNVLKVLQGYTKGIRFIALLTMLCTIGVGQMWGAEKTYTFTSKSWGDSESAWTSNKDGGQLTSGRGVQVSTTYTGAGATSKSEFNNVSRVVVVYSTNASKGAGTINMQIGSNAQKSFTVTSSGGTTDRNAEFSFSPAESGKVKLTINCTTNSIYVKSITIETSESGGEDPGTGGEDPDPEPEPGTGGEAASYTWDLTKESYSASSTSQVTWSATDVNMVLTKESSTTDANNYLGGTNAHTRVYKDQKITFTPAANVTITSIEIVSTSTDYASKFKSSTWSNATAAASGSTVTITPSNGANAIICTITAATRASKVTVNYTKAASGEPEPVIVRTLKSIAVTGMKTTYEQGDIFKFNGTCTATYSVTKDGVAQADETAEVTPTSVSTPNMNTVGTQTITVTYETVSTTYDITITENEVTPGTYDVLLDNELWNVASGQQAASVESMSGKANDITFYTTKGSSQMYANATETRFYKDQTFTISVPEGYLIKSITFAEPTFDKKWEGSITVNAGTYTDGTKTWTGSAQEVQFTFNAQNRIANASITYEAIDLTLPSAPTFNPEAGTYNAVQNVTISAEAGTTIYYTLDGTDPTTESNVYSTPIEIAETKTLKAIAVKDEKVSPIASAKYTINLPLTTMDQIFAKATAVGSTATSVEITFDNWVVSAVKEDGKTAFVTDGTKGFAIFDKDVHLGFSVGNTLSGTATCKVQLYNGFAELTELKSNTAGLSVGSGGTITTQELDATAIEALTGINTGSLIKINGICSSSNLNYYVAGVQIYTSLYNFGTLEVGAEYNITGIYQPYNATKEMLPRSAADIEKVVGLPTATISIADITIKVGETKNIEATITPDAAQSTVQYAITTGSEYITLNGTTITAVAAGTATITATIAEVAGEYYGTTMTFTVTVPTTYDVTWLVSGDEWATTESVEKGTQVASLPSEPTDECGGKAFVGWSTQTVTDGNKPAVLFTDAANSPIITDKTTFHAVFATASGEEIVTSSLPRNIVYWAKQEIVKDQQISATTGSGIMTSNVALSTESNRTYQSTIDKYAQIILSDLNLEDYTNINLSFWARGSQEGSITIKTNLSGEPIQTINNITGTETLYVIENIPASATSITLSYGANSGSFFFGTVKIYENTATKYAFTKLTEENTNGWTEDDWDGYYLITNAQNSLRALDGNSIGEKFHQEVTDEDGTIETSLSMAFLISSTQNGFTIKGVGDNLYLATGNNSISVSSEAKYYTIGHNKIEAQSSKLSWNNSASKFGFYGAIQTSAPQLYKIMRFYSDYTTSCLNVNWTISEGGTLSTESGITTTVIPNEGYTYGEPAYTVSGSATVTQNGNIFTAVPTTDCTIQINMVQKTTYTVTWMVNGKEYTEGDPSTTVYAGESVATLPTPPEPNAYCGNVFVGWTTETPASGNFNEAPTVYNEQSAFPTASANQTFYAVFADYEQQ